MSATQYDISIEKRACFDLPITLTDENDIPIDLNSITLVGQIRRVFDNELQASFNFSVLNSGTASVLMSLTTGQTANIDYAQCYYDIFMDDSSDNCSDRILYGSVEVIQNITT